MATYWVEAGHGGTNSGTEANPWLTIDQAMNAVGAGDKVWVKASANYAELVTIDTVGGDTTPIVFEGYTSATGDGGTVTITGGAARASCLNDSLAINVNVYYVFKNFRFTNSTGVNVDMGCDHVTFKNCRFDTAGSLGLRCQVVLCQGCSIDTNVSAGVHVNGGTGAIFIGCAVHSNGGAGIICDYPIVLLYCTLFSNVHESLTVGSGDTICVIVNCTIDGDSKDTTDGIWFSNKDLILAVVNTVFYDCETGMNHAAGNLGERVISLNNCVNSNTADYNNMETFAGEVVAAPNFVNEVGGADYTPDTGSPLIGAGFDASGNGDMDIGAIQVAAGGGGGGMLVHPGTSGGARG